MSIIQLKIETIQPVLATSFEGDPNSDVSYPYLPGSMLRGAFIGRYLRQSHQQELDLTDALVQSLFFDDQQSVYLNAYPVSQSDKRTLPIPRSWVKEKGQDIPLTAYDFSIEVNEDVESPKPVGNSFWGYDSKNKINLYQPQKRINIHNARDRAQGRGTATEGEIFRYEAIDAGETFKSAIICPIHCVAAIEKLLKPQGFWLGGSQSAGYGHVRITYEVIDTDTPWREAGHQPEAEHKGLQITLLSDMILQDDEGQITANPDLLRRAIAEKFGINLTFHPERRSYIGHTTIGGFNRKWGLPLPQMPALAMGSVLVLKGELTGEQIQQLEAEGIGDRRIDGFGRVAVNFWQEETFNIVKPYAPDPNPPELTLTGADLDLTRTVAQRILYQRLELQLQKKASELSIRGKISNSQLSRLRLTAREAISTDNSTTLILMLCNLPKNARDQFDGARVDGKSLTVWITENVNSPGQWILNEDDLTVTIANHSYPIDDAMKREYTLRLIMALAKKATKMEASV
ncbi:MAG: RAMP superfamily CRISPR-associated protein [Leptolyngbyaceae bacterium]|nr:RAMP superfamily CRISPR-associated protein [Leptolyngbyaceae bacterium]